MKDERREILYLDMWVGERIQEMKLAGIRRFASMAGWNVVPVSEAESRPGKLRALLKQSKPDGVIVECSAAHTDLPPRRFGKIPVVYLDSSRSLYGSGVARSVHDYKLTLRTAMRELSANRPECYAFVGYREKRVWSVFRERGFKVLANEAGYPSLIFKWAKERESVRAERLKDWVKALPRKSAVLSANDNTALEVVAAAKAAHRAIPRDFTLLSIDNLEDRCLGSEPTVSSIQIDWERSGYLAARLLNDIMSGHAESNVVKFGPLLTVHRQSTRGFGRTEPRILSAMDLIRREACNGLSAADVTAQFSGSRRLVELRFRETLGHSILDEIQNVRMEKVQFLLAKTDTPISAIAARCGYRSDVALRKAFRLFTSKSLADWRKANR